MDEGNWYLLGELPHEEAFSPSTTLSFLFFLLLKFSSEARKLLLSIVTFFWRLDLRRLCLPLSVEWSGS